MNSVTGANGVVTKWQLISRPQPIGPDLAKLKIKMNRTRQQDFMDYFNNHKLLQPVKPVAPNIQGTMISASEVVKAAQPPQLYQVASNPNVPYMNQDNGLPKQMVDNLGPLLNDYCQGRL